MWLPTSHKDRFFNFNMIDRNRILENQKKNWFFESQFKWLSKNHLKIDITTCGSILVMFETYNSKNVVIIAFVNVSSIDPKIGFCIWKLYWM